MPLHGASFFVNLILICSKAAAENRILKTPKNHGEVTVLKVYFN